MTVEDVTRGPGTGRGPAPGPWTVLSGKREGITPGFTVLDANSERWFIKFDPPKHPEMASGAEVVVTKLFHAMGYHVPENTIAVVRREELVLTEESTTVGMNGSDRRMRSGDLDALLRGAARRPDGSYRVLASKALPGEPVGPFLFVGTRPDDQNDVVLHEHRRELRGLRAFAAWVNHVDAKALNTLDTLVSEEDRLVVRHHLIDFGSTLGSAAIKPREFDEGYMYIVEPRSLLTNALSFGFHIRPFERIRYPGSPRGWKFFCRSLRSRPLEAAGAESGLSPGAGRRPVLGRTPSDGLHGRDDPRRRGIRPLQRPGGCSSHHGDVDRASRPDWPRVADGRQPDRRPLLRRHAPVVQERRC